MTKVNVKFNYFQVRLCRNEKSHPWDMLEFLNFLSVKRNEIECAVSIGEYIAELDRDTFVVKDTPFISFQIAKLRDKKIPFLKRLNEEAKPLPLDPNQYLGEYITLVYDPVYYVLGVQSNLFSLNTKQVEAYLTDLREHYNLAQGNPIDGLEVSLCPIIDNSKVDKIKKADIIREIEINAAVFKLEGFQNSTFNKLANAFGKLGGANFHIKVSLGNAPKAETLSPEEVQSIISELSEKSDEEKINMKVKLRENLEEEIEVVNLLSPRIYNSFSLEVESRSTIAHELIHNNFIESYKKKGTRNSISKVLAKNEETKVREDVPSKLTVETTLG